MVFGALFLVCFASAHAQKSGAETPTPAPAPEAEHVNLTQLLSVAGPFHTFLKYLESTKLSDEFQNQADNTDEGITIFVPKDGAFSSLKKPSLSNLTQDQLKSLILFHALPHYYSLSDFRNLSDRNPIPTFAGGAYALNFTDKSGTILIDSGWTRTKVTSAVHAADPVAIYETDKVLLPEAIFGTDIPPMPAPAPAPEIAPSADAPAADKAKSTDSSSSPTSSHSSSHVRMVSKLGHVATALVLMMMMML